MYKLRLSISWQGIFICYDKDKEEKGSKPGKKMSVYQQTCMKLKWYKFIFSVIKYVLRGLFVLHLFL
ncbi:hypothetical protein [Prevotella veroralis]|uniref:hypothetical protein n=1 Tax=Prevotella veroralis TaxID=28137 RepID=UPI000381BAC1|nr:hypothetical protein [Prevotella veroralis]